MEQGDKMKEFVVFPTLDNNALYEVFYNRAKELGYKDECFKQGAKSVTLSTQDGYIMRTILNHESGGYVDTKHLTNHENGDIRKFLFTDHYKYEPKLIINDEVVEFEEDGIKVGCTTVDKETILKIAERFK